MALEPLFKLDNEAIFDTDRDRALAVVREAVARGGAPEDRVFQSVVPAMALVAQSVTANRAANRAGDFSLAPELWPGRTRTSSRCSIPPLNPAVGRQEKSSDG
jgi:hypothetical protein